MKKEFLIAPLLIVVTLACAPRGAQPSSELAAMDERWEAALNSGDMETLVAMYTGDARIMPPNAVLGQGHSAVRESFQGMMDAGLKGDLETVEAFVAGDLGYRLGTYALIASDGSTIDRGKYIETWSKADGSWKISNDIWNSDMPPPPASGSTLIFTHEVKDADHWLAAWSGESSRREMFAPHGVTNARVFQNPDKPNMTGLLLQVDN